VAVVPDVQIVVVDGPNTGREFDLSGATVVGRDQSAGLVIDDAEASRRHASLSVEGTTVTVEDLGSTNGTFVNGARISGSKELANGDKVRIGTTVFELRVPQAEPAEEPISDQATRMGTALPDLDELQATAPRQVPDFAKEPEPPAAAPPEPPAAAPEPPSPEPVAPEPVQPTAANIPQPPAPTNAPPPSAGPPGGAGGPPGGGPPPSAPPPPSGPPPGAPPPAAGPPPSAAPPPPAAAPPPPVGAPAGAYSPAPYGGGATSTSNYPINVEADYPQKIANWRPLVHWLFAIPQFIALFFVIIAAYFAFIGVWFSVLFTRRYPAGLFNFITGALRWGNRVNLYTYFMTEEYPPFSLDQAPYPIRTSFTYPEAGISRWRVFFQGILAIPHFIVLYFLGIGAYVGAVIAFFAVLFTGNYPPAVFNFMVGVFRWQTRVFSYVLLMTEEYPPFSLE
jgi:hypothetical protein